MVTEDRTQFPPDYSGQEIIGMGPRAFAWSYKDDLNPMVNPEQIGRRPPPERCHESKEACVAAAWIDHDARAAQATHPTEAPAHKTVLEELATALAERVRVLLQRAHDRFLAGEDEVPYQLGHLQGCLRLEGDPTDRETVRMTTTQWREQMALAHYNGAMLGMQALCRRAEVLAAEEEAADAAARGEVQ